MATTVLNARFTRRRRFSSHEGELRARTQRGDGHVLGARAGVENSVSVAQIGGAYSDRERAGTSSRRSPGVL